jgi:stage II sporulation protein D
VVKSLTVSGTNVTGAQLRKALELRSNDFDIVFKEGTYTFTVRGYGHSLGMSQNGANYLAKQGKTFEEILLYYYTGCKIE